MSLSKSEMADVLERVRIFFPRFDLSEEVVLGWWQLFKNDSFLAVRDAMDNVLRSAQYAPKPGDLSAALGRSMKPVSLYGGSKDRQAELRYFWDTMRRDLEKGVITVYRRHPKGFATYTKKRTTEAPVGEWSFEGETLPRFMEPAHPDVQENLGQGEVWKFSPRPHGLALVEKRA